MCFLREGRRRGHRIVLRTHSRGVMEKKPREVCSEPAGVGAAPEPTGPSRDMERKGQRVPRRAF